MQIVNILLLTNLKIRNEIYGDEGQSILGKIDPVSIVERVKQNTIEKND